MKRLDSLLRKLADPKDRELLDHHPHGSPKARIIRLRVLGRVGLKYWWAYLAIVLLLGFGTVSSGMDVYHRTEQPQFCGVCHEMSPNFASWEASRHKNITCADCHARPGAGGWILTKAAGVRQLFVHLSGGSMKQIKVEENQRATINANCKRCHSALARINERFSLGVSHRQHLDKGIECTTCHTGAFTHPPKESPDNAATPRSDHLEARFVEVAACYTCHDGKTQVAGTNAFDAKDEVNCLKCHPDADQAFAHGARDPKSAGRKPCLDCHDLNTSAAGKPPHFEMANSNTVCLKCHKTQEHEGSHTPYSSGECGECHTVMSAAYLYKTGPRPTNQMCLGCHDTIEALLKGDKKGEEEPEVGGFSVVRAGKATDLHQQHAQKLGATGNDWCLSCHAPHWSTSMRGLLRLRPQPDFKRPASAKQTMYAGGSCEGGCHDTKVTYSGPGE